MRQPKRTPQPRKTKHEKELELALERADATIRQLQQTIEQRDRTIEQQDATIRELKLELQEAHAANSRLLARVRQYEPLVPRGRQVHPGWDKPWVTLREAAEMTGFTIGWLRDLCTRQTPPPLRSRKKDPSNPRSWLLIETASLRAYIGPIPRD